MPGSKKSLRVYMEEGFEAIREDIIELSRDVTEIRHTLGGNNYQRGICDEVRKQDKRIAKLEKIIAMAIGGGFVIQIVIVLLIKYL